MVDLGFLGPRYTWTNKRDINNLILERIDRFFMNPEWCMLHPEAKITHLPRCHSDHCPVLLETNPGRTMSLIKPFRFQELQLSDTFFPSIVSKAWNTSLAQLNLQTLFPRRLPYGIRTILETFTIRRNGFWLDFVAFKRHCQTTLVHPFLLLKVSFNRTLITSWIRRGTSSC